MGQFKNLKGKVFGRLRPIKPFKKKLGGLGRLVIYWDCTCECGEKVKTLSWHLTRGKTKSCGCLNAELIAKKNTTHGKTHHKDYGMWSAMIRRCYNQNAWNYKYYGAIGINVCSRWRIGIKNRTAFECFLDDMGERPRGMSIDRIDPFGNYNKKNCKWSNAKEQALNKRKRK